MSAILLIVMVLAFALLLTAHVTLDSANNVEMVEVASAASGEWRINVVGSNIPEGPQAFALVIIGRVA